MSLSETSWGELDRLRVVLFAADAELLARLEASTGGRISSLPTSDWEEALLAVTGADVAAIVVHAATASEALERLSEASSRAPYLERIAVAPAAALPELLAAHSRGVLDGLVLDDAPAGEVEWAVRAGFLRIGAAKASSNLVDALRRDRAAARREVDALHADLGDARSRLDRIAPTDGVTGLYNRRHFLDHWRREVARARRYQLPLSLVLLEPLEPDLADEQLRTVATFLVQQVRDVDFVARTGDRRFAIVLPHCGGRNAARMCGRLLEDLTSAEQVHLVAGAASLRDDGEEPARVLEAAELSLERALS